MNGFRVMLVFVMHYIYVTSGSSLLIESTDSMIMVRLSPVRCFIHSVLRPHAMFRLKSLRGQNDCDIVL